MQTVQFIMLGSGFFLLHLDNAFENKLQVRALTFLCHNFLLICNYLLKFDSSRSNNFEILRRDGMTPTWRNQKL